MDKIEFMKYLYNKYGYPSDKDLQTFLDKQDIENMDDFVENTVQYIENKIDNVNVYYSSTWAVCKEFLNELNKNDSNYTKGRSGKWNDNITMRDIIYN